MKPINCGVSVGLVTLAWSTTFHGPLVGQDLPGEVQKVLDQRVGRWEIRTDVLDAHGAVVRQEHEVQQAEFAINGQIVEVRGLIDGREDFRSFLLFNPMIGKYMLATIDRSNNHVDMTAERDAPYRFTSSPVTGPDGASRVIRRIFDTVEPDAMSCYLEVSLDGGVTWRRIYHQAWRRVP
jgi:hypothetical protein